MFSLSITYKYKSFCKFWTFKYLEDIQGSWRSVTQIFVLTTDTSK